MDNKESQFGMPPGRIEELRRRHKKEQEEASGEGMTSVSEVEGIAEKGLAEEKNRYILLPRVFSLLKKRAGRFPINK